MWTALKLDLNDAMLAIRRRWFRSVLSSLGIAIGVCALIVTLSISEGALKKSTAQYHQLGLNTLRIQAPLVHSVAAGGRTLKESDFAIIASLAPKGALISGVDVVENISIKSRDLSGTGTVIYATELWTKVERLNLSAGDNLVPLDFVYGEQRCLVGSLLATELALQAGKSILSYRDNTCFVVGIVAPNEGGFVQNNDIRFTNIDSAVILPLSTRPLKHAYEIGQLTEVTVLLPVDEPQEVLDIAKSFRASLGAHYQSLLNYQLIVPLELVVREKENQKTFVFVMMAISIMILLVGGVSIMNIMLTHITEQTREIGLRLAVGAEPKRVMQTFLLHSLLITISGCAIGSVVGCSFVFVFGQLSEWPISLSVFAIVMGPIFSLVIGAVFGLYPALRASQMDPIIMLKEQ